MSNLKEQNKKQLTVLLCLALIPLCMSLITLNKTAIDIQFEANIWGILTFLTKNGIPPLLVITILITILNISVDLVNNNWKERLAHFRWNNPLPGCRANKLIKNDPRIDINSVPDEIKTILDSELTPAERNSYWVTTP